LYKKQLPVINHWYALKKGNIRKDLKDKAAAAENGMDYGPSLALESVACVVIEVEADNPDTCKDCGTLGHISKRSSNSNFSSNAHSSCYITNYSSQSNDPNCCCDFSRLGHKLKGVGIVDRILHVLPCLISFVCMCLYVVICILENFVTYDISK